MSLFVQFLLPQKLLSRVIGILTRCQLPFIKNILIRLFIRFYKIDLNIAAQKNISEYASFNAFFTRALDESTRLILRDDRTIIAPVDGTISQLGKINTTELFQAKGLYYSLQDLLQDVSLALCFENGSFITIYLSPKDYHRVHLPFSGVLRSIRYIPGRLFSVNEQTTNRLKNLYAKNERISCFFETELGGMIIVFVGALLVSGINTIWTGQIANYAQKTNKTFWQYDEHLAKILKQSAEIGFFEFGSTVIILFEKDKVSWLPNLEANCSVSMGQSIALI